MTIASDLTRIKDAKQAIKTAIAEKGVTVPDTELISTYHAYIDQIGSATPPTGDGTLADLKQALNYGNAATVYPVGTEFADTYDGASNPLIVAQYLDETNNSAYGGAVGVIMVRKYLSNFQIKWDNNVNYRDSYINTQLNGDMFEKCSTELKQYASEIDIPYAINGNNIIMVKTKQFIMSTAEVMSKNPSGSDTPAEGFGWDLWEQRTGLTSPSYLENEGRIMANSSAVVESWWLRSWVSSSNVAYTAFNGQVSFRRPSSSIYLLPAYFIGKDT